MTYDTDAILGILAILQTAQFYFMGSVKSKVDKLSNGCYERHLKLEREAGANSQTLNALHSRLDKVEEIDVRNRDN